MTADSETHFSTSLQPPVLTFNPGGASRFVVLCDHASNRIPDAYGTLGLSAQERIMHIAWDPGSLAVSKALADLLDAPLVQSTFSRLVIDPNRAPDADDLIPALSETTAIPGNADIEDADRAERIATYHAPYHAAIADLLDARAASGLESVIVAVHSFTPVFKGVERPWHAGLIHGDDEAFSQALFSALQTDHPDLNIGWNEPYRAAQGIYHTVSEHADRRGLPGTMVEIRHDEILEPAGATRWARRIARSLDGAVSAQAPSRIRSA